MKGMLGSRNGELRTENGERRTELLIKLRRLPGQPLDSLGDWRVSREQAAEVDSQQRLHNEQVRRRGRRDHGHTTRVGIQLLQCARQSVRIPGKGCASMIGLVFARAGNRQLNQSSRNRATISISRAASPPPRSRSSRSMPPKIIAQRPMLASIVMAPARVATIELIRMSRLRT